jgi:SDR family mycofactocin-dependent oxidoreductase
LNPEPRAALVTGAARGQGRAEALRLARDGYDLLLVDLCADIAGIPYPLARPEDLAETARLAARAGRRVEARRADVRDAAGLAAAVADGAGALGGLDAVVANAGVFAAAPVAETVSETWQALLDTNLSGAWNTARAALPILFERGAGAIVFVASIAGLKGIENLGAYAAAKHGVIGLMRTLAIEMAPRRIRVNAVCPTNVGTDLLHNEAMYRLFVPGDPRPDDDALRAAFQTVNRMPVPWIEPEDVAEAVAWLLSDAARFVTGTALAVDAGALLN